ncbi:MAG: CRISPR-associated protein [Oscillatoria sp. PMC 1051.18]|nr:CRISPR-associated protein [Oscillatoria sp. PMC 1050.18]MEC5029866.1 CRISPR-associated protein [Oscillatoria sp. PMC 1051.18]
MNRVVISTIGTSLLTKQINRGDNRETNWFKSLTNTANFLDTELDDEVKKIIKILQSRAKEKLATGKTEIIRGASAELNGIYGIYQDNLLSGKEDIHYLIATDTAQGKATAEIVQTFLQENGIVNVSIYQPPGLSTKSTLNFSEGIDDLIVWLDKEIPPLKENKYKVCFNLVGGFKSLQGYLNTIGMFYADEIIYIFEGKGSDSIAIPRLPIAVDNSLVAPYTVQLALLDAGMGMTKEETEEIPETLLGEVDGKMTLSSWGQLIWNQCKENLLAEKLLDFPYLEYQDSFREDYNQIRERKEKVKLQESLAKVSYLLAESNGDTSILKKDGGIQYDKYVNKGDMEHFRVTQGLRVSCTSAKGSLLLHRYGKEPDVNKNPY